MDNSALRETAKAYGFARAYFLPPPHFAPHDDEPGIVWDSGKYPWAGVSLLLVRPYRPYPKGERIPAYYINSNASYHAAVALARGLESMGVRLLRCELPVKRLMSESRAGELCRNSLVALPDLGTRVVFQTMLLGSGNGHTFTPEAYPAYATGRCAACRACETACPAHAISADGLDVKKCMRYYMDGADYPEWVYGVQSTHMGCEVCQAVCPRNAACGTALPENEVKSAFDLERLAAGDTKAARLLVGKNFTGRGKLQKEALNFIKRDGAPK
ncbi:MAG: 4Fe-4S dicluster domain-containing protein [Clostridia bacterium]|nr:4Fe-4S dicluster domain-containing protein [Clostridia bacterium]